MLSLYHDWRENAEISLETDCGFPTRNQGLGAILALSRWRGDAMLMLLVSIVTVIAAAGMLRLCELRSDEKEELGYWTHDERAKQA